MEWSMKQKQSEIERNARTAWMWNQEQPCAAITAKGQLSEKAVAVLADFLENGSDQMRLQAADIVLRHLSGKEAERKRLLKRVFSK
jgi:phage terminase large subunit-like protein